MKAGDKFTVEINSVGMDGEGVARVEGFVVFIPKTLLGEQAVVEITQVKKSFAFAKVIKLLKASEARIQPPCDLCFKCGGCEMLHISYEAQLEIKRNTVKNCIDRECGIDCFVDDTVASPDVYNYRNKVQLPISRQNGKAVGGYFAPNTHIVVPSSVCGEKGKCVLNANGIQGVVDIFLKWLDESNISVYEEKSRSGLVRHLVVRKIGEKYSICIVINGDSLPHYKTLIDKLKKADYEFSLYVSVNKKNTNVILGDKTVCLYGENSITGEALGVRFGVSVLSFMQINDKVRDMIYTRVGKIIEENDISNVIDAYSGIGIMSNIFAKYAKNVYAIEIVEDAVKDGIALAKANGNADKIKFICGDCARELPPLISTLDKSLVVLDPPRKGCDLRVLESLLKAKPTEIIYISCNPATLARDVKFLLNDYEIQSVTPYDMFPHTKHIETMICLKRK
ncbi:MAG: 23S rRNA (uracil(1939)-C(5))-methyltransferase RlmD [Clostridia bacterium]|nr:23S rRNA (uracil(1939)-C(5))-methyltransferase RlmD [Clostridia bacterium]